MVDRKVALSLAAVMVLSIAAVLGFVLAQHHMSMLTSVGGAADGTLLITNNDGYYHLIQALRMADQPFSVVTHSFSHSLLLPKLLVMLSGPDTQSLMKTGIFVGPVLGLTMLLAVLPWCLGVRSLPVVVLAPLLAYLSPYWLERTHVGVLDTDVLVPCLVYLALYCVMRYSTAGGRRWAWPMVYLFVLAFLWLWWKPGVFICLSLAGCYLIYWPGRRGDSVIKFAVLAGIATVVFLGLKGVDPFYGYGNYLIDHIRLAFGSVSGSLLSGAVIELNRLTPADLAMKSLGSVWLPFSVPLGAIAYLVRYRWDGLFLVAAGLGFGSAALWSQRFVPLFVPAAAFFAVYFLVVACNWFGKLLERRFSVRDGVASVALLIFSAPALLWGVTNSAIGYEPKSYYISADYDLAQLIRTEFPVETMLWTWWDYGYFFKFFSERDVFFDGGSQTELTCFTAAYPLMQNDMETAARWIRHFSDVPVTRLDLSKRGSQWHEYLADYAAKAGPSGHTERPVALCLPARIYTTVGYIYSFAHIFDASVPPVVNRLDLFPKEGFRYEPDAGVVVVPEALVTKGYDSFGSVVDATGKTPGQIDFRTLGEPYLVHSDATDFLAVTDSSVVGTVLFRLLGLFEDDGSSFEPVWFDYRKGGIWRVH